MIIRIASKVVKRFVDNSVIDDTERELYLYGFFVLISQILYFILTIIFGILLDIVLQSVIFYVTFQFIRRYAGGIHASSELKCEVMTTTSIFLCLLCVKLSEMIDLQNPILVLTLIATIAIFILSPLDTPEKPLTKEEFQYFRKISLLVLTIMLFVIIVSVIIKSSISYPICLSIILEGILLITGKIKREYSNKHVK
jgi:accessory gene regulator B